MSEPIEISYEAKTLAKAIYYAYSSASPANIGILIQQLLNAETEKLHKELYDACELHTMQLAAIMTASIQNTESTVKDRITRDHPYCSQSYLDVCATVDREMQLRNQVHECGAMLQQRNKEIEKLRKENEKLKSTVTAWALGVEQSNTDIVDMQRDEFRRIIAINPCEEVIGICNRAIAVIEQTVPVVVQRDQLQTDLYKLRKENEELRERIAILEGRITQEDVFP